MIAVNGCRKCGSAMVCVSCDHNKSDALPGRILRSECDKITKERFLSMAITDIRIQKGRLYAFDQQYNMFDISELNLMNVYEKSYVDTDRRVKKEELKVLCQKSFLSYDYHQYGENQYQKFNCQRDQFAITKIILENGIQIKKNTKQQRFNY